MRKHYIPAALGIIFFALCIFFQSKQSRNASGENCQAEAQHRSTILKKKFAEVSENVGLFVFRKSFEFFSKY